MIAVRPPRRRSRTALIAVVAGITAVVAASSVGVGFALTSGADQHVTAGRASASVAPSPPGFSASPSLAPTVGASASLGVTSAPNTQGGGDSSPAPTPASSPPAAAISINVERACDLNMQMRAAARDSDVGDAGATIDKIVGLLATEDPDLRLRATLLRDDYLDAVAARGRTGARVQVLKVWAASIELSAACRRAGWTPS